MLWSCMHANCLHIRINTEERRIKESPWLSRKIYSLQNNTDFCKSGAVANMLFCVILELYSVKRQLSDMFQLIVTWQDHILGFHHSIVHTFGYLEIKIQVCDVIITPVRSHNARGIYHQLLDRDMNDQIAVYFRVPIIRHSLNFVAQIPIHWMYMKLCQVSLVS